MQASGAEVIAGNYMIRYLFACVGTATVLPAIQGIGVGWFSTVSAGFLVVSGGLTAATVKWGKGWRDEVDKERRAKRGAKMEMIVEKVGDEEKAAPAVVLAKGEDRV